MYSAFSFDGIAWTTPTPTNFPDACARSNSGMLPDGQVYVIVTIEISEKGSRRVVTDRDYIWRGESEPTIGICTQG